MKRVAFAALAAACLLGPARPAVADSNSCGIPSYNTLWIDYADGSVDFWQQLFARPGIIGATTTTGAQLRAAGALNVYWDMYLNNRVGQPSKPADPSTIVAKANKLFDFAVNATGCATPWIAENELSGAGLETPWSDSNALYRQNVLAYLQALAARGARPFLLVNSAPYTGGEAAAWWQQVASVADIVRETYFSAKRIHALGPVLGNRTLRESLRLAVGRFLAIGIPPSRLGVMLGFQSNTSNSGRAGLQPSQAWFDVVKWQALAARQVAEELHFSSIWSWGWTSYTGNPDPDFPKAACIWLWTRTASLCNGPGAAGPGWNASVNEGQLDLPSGTQCTVGRDRIADVSISRLEALTGDRDVAYSAAYARAIESRVVRVTTSEVSIAERALIANRFNGSRLAYRAALAQAHVSPALARTILADELRREKRERNMHVGPPSSSQVGNFYESYPDMLVRPVKATPAPIWLGGKTKGYALEAVAPEGVFSLATRKTRSLPTIDGTFKVRAMGEARALGSMPLAKVAPAIRVALRSFALGDAYEQWTTKVQNAELAHAVCRGDDLPVPGPVELETYVPFLAVGAQPPD